MAYLLINDPLVQQFETEDITNRRMMTLGEWHRWTIQCQHYLDNGFYPHLIDDEGNFVSTEATNTTVLPNDTLVIWIDEGSDI